MNTHSCPSAIHIVCLLFSAFAGCQNSDAEIAKGASSAIREQESEGSKQFAVPDKKALSSVTTSEDSHLQRQFAEGVEENRVQSQILDLVVDIRELEPYADESYKAILNDRLYELHEQFLQKPYDNSMPGTYPFDPRIRYHIGNAYEVKRHGEPFFDSHMNKMVNHMNNLNPKLLVAELEKIKKELVELKRKTQESGDAKSGQKPLAPPSE